jgi:glutamate-5-semialdehyde dehydrogenase
MDLKKEILAIAQSAKDASRRISGLSSAAKSSALKDMGVSLMRHKDFVLKANHKDVSAFKPGEKPRAFIDRLTLTEKRLKEMADSLVQIAGLPDPVGEVIKGWSRPNGLWIHKVRTPIGVVAVIYESRPNVTSDSIGLCFKSGNCVILKGGSDSLQTNLAIFKVLKDVLKKHGLPEGAVQLINTTDRKAVDLLLKLDSYIDLVMPRGGEGLIRRVVKVSRIPVIKHYKGICHVYVDEGADLNMAENICFNAKVQRPGVCNAMECMLVHEHAAGRFLPGMLKRLKEAGVQIRGDELTRRIGRDKEIRRATTKDYQTEYLDLILSVKVVKDLEEAISHINSYGTRHSDSIVTDNYDNALRFLREVDSACVYVNASTRFTDGNQFGMGAEIGISTDKLHARGPMALEELTTYKYMIFGNGQVRT